MTRTTNKALGIAPGGAKRRRLGRELSEASMRLKRNPNTENRIALDRARHAYDVERKRNPPEPIKRKGVKIRSGGGGVIWMSLKC